jgi:hypothetical protein
MRKFKSPNFTAKNGYKSIVGFNMLDINLNKGLLYTELFAVYSYFWPSCSVVGDTLLSIPSLEPELLLLLLAGD